MVEIATNCLVSIVIFYVFYRAYIWVKQRNPDDLDF